MCRSWPACPAPPGVWPALTLRAVSQRDFLPRLEDLRVIPRRLAGRGEGRRILGDGREGVVVHGDGQPGLDQPHRPEGVRRAHGVEVPDRQQGRIDVIVLQQGHIHGEGRVSGVIDGLASHLKEEAAGRAPGRAAAVKGLDEFGGAEGQADRATQVAGDAVHPGGAEHRVRQIRRAAHLGAGAPGDGHGVPHVVPVAVGDKEIVRPDLLRPVGVSGAGEEGVRQHLAGAVVQQKAGVSQKLQFHIHSTPFPSSGTDDPRPVSPVWDRIPHFGGNVNSPPPGSLFKEGSDGPNSVGFTK